MMNRFHGSPLLTTRRTPVSNPTLALPSPSDAKLLPHAHYPSFFSPSLVSRILSECSYISKTLSGTVTLTGPKRGRWSTSYLHTAHAFQNRNPDIHSSLITLASSVSSSLNWCLFTPTLSTRCVEYHTVGVTGGLPQKEHHDHGSAITVDVMLQEPLSGGAFKTHALDSSGILREVSVPFKVGDAVVFPSHKYHWVEHVTEGERKVLIMELWEGPERACNHRCEIFQGQCGYKKKAVHSHFIGM